LFLERHCKPLFLNRLKSHVSATYQIHLDLHGHIDIILD
jgi:hypothetical protein